MQNANRAQIAGEDATRFSGPYTRDCPLGAAAPESDERPKLARPSQVTIQGAGAQLEAASGLEPGGGHSSMRRRAIRRERVAFDHLIEREAKGAGREAQSERCERETDGQRPREMEIQESRYNRRRKVEAENSSETWPAPALNAPRGSALYLP